MKNSKTRPACATALLLALSMTLLPVSGVRAEGYPGFGLNTSRVVVMADAPGGTTVTALNNSDNVYLVQSQVWPAKGLTGYPEDGKLPAAGTVPFLVTPPLKRMGPQSRLPLRILTTAAQSLPQDRESLFFLSAKAIPSVPPASGKESTSVPRVVMALQQFVKLYWRPAGLKPRALFDGEVAPKLRMSLVGGKLHVQNPTPYYITFGVLKVNGKPLKADDLRVMTPPKGGQDYPLPAGVTGGQVEWQAIDEFGLVTKAQTQTLG